MFDFPSSPAIGDSSNGYTWNGTGWTNGPGVQGPQTEQFFDAGGRSTIDIAVPTWAKQALIYTSLWNTTASAQVNMLVSGDGTTFPNAANDYTIAGFTHQSGGTGTYANQAQLNINRVPLNLALNNASIPNLTEIQITTARGPTFAGRIVSSVYDNTAAVLYAYRFHSFYVNAAMAGATQLKALRIYTDLGTWRDGSNLRVKWIGDSAAMPQTNAISEAPMDGNEYTRVNGVWRLKSQTIDAAGLTNIDIAVPPGAKIGRFFGSLHGAAVVASNSVALRASLDGTNFLTTASDYHYTGWIHYSGAANPGMATLGSVVGATAYLCFNNDNDTIVSSQFRLDMAMLRNQAAAAPWYGIVNSTSYNTAAANAYNNAQMRVGVMHTNAGSVYDLKKLRFYHVNGGAFAAPSYVDVTWSY